YRLAAAVRVRKVQIALIVPNFRPPEFGRRIARQLLPGYRLALPNRCKIVKIAGDSHERDLPTQNHPSRHERPSGGGVAQRLQRERREGGIDTCRPRDAEGG